MIPGACKFFEKKTKTNLSLERLMSTTRGDNTKGTQHTHRKEHTHMREKFALQDKHCSTAGESGCEARMYFGVVDCGTGPVLLRLCIWVNGYRFNEDTFKSEPYGPASWVFEMMPAKTQGKGGAAKRRGMGETGGMSVTFDQVWDLIESYGLPSDYSFA